VKDLTIYKLVYKLSCKTSRHWRHAVEMYASAITDYFVWSWPWPLTLKTFSAMPIHILWAEMY